MRQPHLRQVSSRDRAAGLVGFLPANPSVSPAVIHSLATLERPALGETRRVATCPNCGKDMTSALYAYAGGGDRGAAPADRFGAPAPGRSLRGACGAVASATWVSKHVDTWTRWYGCVIM